MEKGDEPREVASPMKIFCAHGQTIQGIGPQSSSQVQFPLFLTDAQLDDDGTRSPSLEDDGQSSLDGFWETLTEEKIDGIEAVAMPAAVRDCVQRLLITCSACATGVEEVEVDERAIRATARLAWPPKRPVGAIV